MGRQGLGGALVSSTVAEKKDLDAKKPAPIHRATTSREESSLRKRREVLEAVEKAVKKPQ
jgi:hypothetical protein